MSRTRIIDIPGKERPEVTDRTALHGGKSAWRNLLLGSQDKRLQVGFRIGSDWLFPWVFVQDRMFYIISWMFHVG